MSYAVDFTAMHSLY